MGKTLADHLYEFLAEDEDARVCRDIPESACHEQPYSFIRQLAALTLTKFGDALVSARLMLAWMLAAVGAPAVTVGLLVPVRESLALLPQLFIAQAMRRRPVRKWFWVGGSLGQAAALAGMVPVVLGLEGMAAGIGVIALLAVFSLSRGVCSVASKDVLGKTVSKSRRGRLTGLAASTAGVATLIAAVVLVVWPDTGTAGNGAERGLFAAILALAALLWVAAGIVYGGLREEPGATSGGGNAAGEALRSLSLLWRDAPFRRFVVARALLVSTAFAIPYLVVIAQRGGDGELGDLGALLLANGLAALVSGPVWGRWSDAGAHRVMAMAAGLSVLAMVAALVWHHWVGLPFSGVVAALVLFVAAVAHQGARVGRKTYLVDMATQENRAQYTAVSNTVIGLFLLLGGLLGVLDAWLGTTAVLVFLALVGALAVVRSLSLRSVSD